MRRPVSTCPHAHASPRLRPCRSRSDQPRFFGDRVDLVFQEVDFGLQLRDLLQQRGVLGGELLEEGEDLFVGMMSVHVSEEWRRAEQSSRRRHAGEGKARIVPGREGERAGGRYL